MENKNIMKTIGLIVLVLIVTFIGVKMFVPKSAIQGNDLAQKVLAKKELRVGYVVYPPQLIKDPNTGKLSGIFYDALESAGQKLGVKVSWVEEVGWGTMIEGLKAGRYDIIGSPAWPSSERATQADFTIPLTYSVIAVATRANDTRFDKSFDAINSSNVKISIIDGEIAQQIVKEQFPNVSVVALPQLADKSQSLLDLTTGKADVSFVEPLEIDRFLKNNPGTIKNAQPNNPLRIYGNVMIVPQGQDSFKSMINAALQEELNSGYIDTLVQKYQTSPNSYYPVAKPFALPR